MEFRLLGPVEVVSDGEPIELGRRRERVILAILLLETGRPVPVARLIELLFDDDPPRDPRKAIQVDISRLRRTLSAAGDDVWVTGDVAGYTIHALPETIDVHRFSTLVDAARDADDRTERSRLLHDALALWRAPALADMGDSIAIQSVRARLDELRLAAIELRADTELALGRHTELVAELTDLTAQYPNSERLIAAQMRALYRSGRKRDALDVYQRAADRLVDELGLDPGSDLQETQLAILRDDVEVAAPESIHSTPRPVVRPAQLPADLPQFTGRDDELASLIARSRLPHDTVVISSIDGMAGIGKTALAVHAAHQLAPDHPDGQLFIDLNGFTEGVDPVPPSDALGRLLRALGIPDAQIPPSTDERAALYRSTLADRRVLVLLDNATAEDQVVPLLPGTSGCLALVTSRNRLAGLDQASPLSLDVLPAAEAATLFTRVAGVSRLADEPPELTDEVVELCGRLPLAIRIAAARLRSRSAWNLAHLRDRLRDEHLRLAALEAGNRSIVTAFELSYRQLTPSSARMFRLLGQHPGYDIDGSAAAALAGCPVQEADAIAADLLDAHLLEEHRTGRYSLHDLIRAYACRHTQTDEGEAERRDAMTRLLDYYTYATYVAMSLLYADEASRRPVISEPDLATPLLDDRERASQWLDSEWANLRAAIRYAAANDAHPQTIRLAQLLWRHFETRGDGAESVHSQALTAAQALGDAVGEVRALVGLGRAYHELGRREAEADVYHEALALARRIGYRLGEVDALNGLARLHRIQGPHESASAYYREGFELASSLGDYVGEVVGLTGLAQLHWMHGRIDQAAESFTHGLTLATEAGDHIGQIDMLNGLARALLQRADHATAKEHLERSLRLAHEINSPSAEVQALNGLGQIYLEERDHESAIACHRSVLDIATEIDDQNYRFEGLLGIGQALRSFGDPSQAMRFHRRALDLARELDQRYDIAAAHEGLADALYDLGRSTAARQHWQQALSIFTDLGVPDAERVRSDLEAVEPA